MKSRYVVRCLRRASSLPAAPDAARPAAATDDVAELHELALDASVSPARVLPREPEDERLDFDRTAEPTTPIHPLAGPLAPDQCAVPFQDRVRLEQEQIPVELTPRAGRRPGERGCQDGQGQLLPAREAVGRDC